MSNFDVGLRLRLDYQKRNAEQAERDLKDIKKAADQLGHTNAGSLDRKLADVRREAGRGEQAISRLGREARQLNSASTGHLDREIKQLGATSRTAHRDLSALRREASNLSRLKTSPLKEMERPAGALNATMGLLQSSAAGAFGALVAFASVDNIVRGLERASDKFRELNRAATDVAITLEMASPETVAKISESNERLGIRYGKPQAEVNSARQRYAASGIGLQSQEAILDPTMKAAMTYRTEGETIADAMIAAKQNLKIRDNEVPAALDMMAKGAKLGSFEVGAMAKNFPSLGAYMAGAGRTGLNGWAELIAMSQVARTTSGSEDEAATNLRNWLSKLSARETVQNFDKKGIDLEKVKKQAEKEGKSYPMAVLDEVMKSTKGDEFRINELFGDQQAFQALKPLLDNRPMFEEFLSKILHESAGGVDADAKNAAKTPYEQAARRGAALEATGVKAGEVYDRVTSPYADRAVRLISPEFDRQRTIEEEPERLREAAAQRLQMENEVLRLQGSQKDSADGGAALGPAIARLKAEIQTLLEEEAAIIENARAARAKDVQPETDSGDLGKSTGKIPIPTSRPIEQQLGKDMSGAAATSMDGYIEQLKVEGGKAEAEAQGIAERIKAWLGFTVSPTISPNFVPPSATPTAGGEKQSSIAPVSNSKVTQYISSPNSKMAAIRARREQGRAIRLAMAGAYDDLGSRPA
ncbi:Putative phage tail tape measure protein, core region [Neorhizobium galegae bv. officinalis bv. officinalis str. HAMBI 1141]|uniref:Putative phage tail tape measure protein, core region n=1 Tax=Neorhizobium galegae bv. officinalis bv. officinalis str. HAMBI 1141 TaxID=1028801 RepID=A0A068T8I0_NEOGA|nr:phage tail tape measure protein [Neorhizobium galegae]CDN54768.1 Putative phage tail tape measure protein, core region [Neorhizobium galegae bv. officinalis bv. officinalis str. HAMBI 1141]